MIPERTRYPGCAAEKRDERLVELAGAVVVAGEMSDERTRRLLARLSAKAVPVRVVGMLTRVGEVAEVPEPKPLRGLSDVSTQ